MQQDSRAAAALRGAAIARGGAAAASTGWLAVPPSTVQQAADRTRRNTTDTMRDASGTTPSQFGSDIAAQFSAKGFAVTRVISPERAAEVERRVNRFIERTPESDKAVTDEAASLGPQPLRASLLKELHELTALLRHDVVRSALAAILGSDDLVLETCRLLAVEAGQLYRQGWHRDVPPAHVVPQEIVSNVLEANASGSWRHNVVQCTLALARDTCYWCVPGSHRRLYTAAELEHFEADSQREDNTGRSQRQQSGPGEGELARIGSDGTRLPLDGSNSTAPGADVPGGTRIELEPGELLLQHNLIIHRGWVRGKLI